MYLSIDCIKQSLDALKEVSPFWGLAFLAFKKANIPIGTTIPVSGIFEVKSHLERYFRPFHTKKLCYFPFFLKDTNLDSQESWIEANNLAEQIIFYFATPQEYHVTSEWESSAEFERLFRESNYATLAKLVNSNTHIPAFCIAVWLFREEDWQTGTMPEMLITRLFEEFNITQEERDAIFDCTIPTLQEDWLKPEPFTDEELEELIGLPPSDISEFGATLRHLELRQTGPAPHLLYEPGKRLNIITGDNGLGKTFLLDCAWWALTGKWSGSPALPDRKSESSEPQISFALGNKYPPLTINYDWPIQSWHYPGTLKFELKNLLKHELANELKERTGFVIYVRSDASIAIWDPLRAQDGKGFLLFEREAIWEGIKADDPNGRESWICNGLIRDWVTWQSGKRYEKLFHSLTACLRELSPVGEEKLAPGEPTRLPSDSREIPTLRLPYGEVPVTHVSAGMKRILSLTYIMVWAWQEHLIQCELKRVPSERTLILMIDEVEAHLHPFWQRAIVPSLLKAIGVLSPQLRAQLHIATHSPMVLASVEPIFDEERDALHHLKQEQGLVTLETLPFVKFGTADNWLMSDVFGLEVPRSLEAEKAIQDATALQLEGKPSPEQVNEVNERLVNYLAHGDEFWHVWRYFALQHGLKK